MLLVLLTRDELLDAIDRSDVVVVDRRRKKPLVDALAASRGTGLAGTLAELPRDRIEEICRALGLADGGCERSTLVERLAGRGVAPPSQTAARTDEPAAACAVPGETATPADGKLTQEKLEGYLWSAADILRGSIDSSDYKNFIFGLVFLKRLADDAGTKGGEFYTPRKVVQLIVGLLEPTEGIAYLRPDMRLWRHVDRVRVFHRALRRQPEEPLPLRPGEEPRDVGDL